MSRRKNKIFEELGEIKLGKLIERKNIRVYHRVKDQSCP